MQLFYFLLAGLIGYLCGSIPFGYLYVRLFKGEDLTKIGSGRTGGTNSFRAAGLGVGVLTSFSDVLKGAAAVWLTRDTSAMTLYELTGRINVTGLQPQASVRLRGVPVEAQLVDEATVGVEQLGVPGEFDQPLVELDVGDDVRLDVVVLGRALHRGDAGAQLAQRGRRGGAREPAPDA